MEVGQDAYTLIPEFVLSDKIDWGNWARQTGHCGIKHRRSLRLTRPHTPRSTEGKGGLDLSL